MGEGLKAIAKRHGGLTVRSAGGEVRYDGEGRKVGSTSVAENADAVCEWCGCPYYMDISKRVGTRLFERYCAPGCEDGTARKVLKRS